MSDIISQLTIENPESVFKTEKGSIYFGNEAGATQRIKSLHVGHDSKDVGLKDPSLFTIYLDRSTAIFLAEKVHQKEEIIIFEDKIFTFVVENGKPVRTSKDYSFERTPRLGLCPYEIFKFEKILDGIRPYYQHFGNRIIAVEL